METIHPTAIVLDGARVGKDVTIGPFCVVGPHVTLADGVHLISHVSLDGDTYVGEGTLVYPFASIGHVPQHSKHTGEITRVVIGKHTKIREHVTIHAGTTLDQGLTSVGDHCFLMASVHVAHDCCIGDYVTLANNVTLGGHVKVGSRSVIGGLAAVHQFTRIGEGSMISGLAGVTGDVLPFGLVQQGVPAALLGLNLVGLRRNKFSREEISAIRQAYDRIFSQAGEVLIHNAESLPKELLAFPSVQKMQTFILTQEKRPLCLPTRWRNGKFAKKSKKYSSPIPPNVPIS